MDYIYNSIISISGSQNGCFVLITSFHVLCRHSHYFSLLHILTFSLCLAIIIVEWKRRLDTTTHAKSSIAIRWCEIWNERETVEKRKGGTSMWQWLRRKKAENVAHSALNLLATRTIICFIIIIITIIMETSFIVYNNTILMFMLCTFSICYGHTHSCISMSRAVGVRTTAINLIEVIFCSLCAPFRFPSLTCFDDFLFVLRLI